MSSGTPGMSTPPRRPCSRAQRTSAIAASMSLTNTCAMPARRSGWFAHQSASQRLCARRPAQRSSRSAGLGGRDERAGGEERRDRVRGTRSRRRCRRPRGRRCGARRPSCGCGCCPAGRGTGSCTRPSTPRSRGRTSPRGSRGTAPSNRPRGSRRRRPRSGRRVGRRSVSSVFVAVVTNLTLASATHDQRNHTRRPRHLGEPRDRAVGRAVPRPARERPHSGLSGRRRQCRASASTRCSA